MFDDLELPPFLRLTKEQRKEAWEKNPPKAPPPLMQKVQRSPEEEEVIRRLEQESLAAKKAKAEASKAKRKERSDYKPGSRWDATYSKWVHPSEEKPTMMSIRNNTRGTTPMKSPNEMNGPELVAAYNVLAPRVGEKPIAKFKDLKTGVRRLNELRAKSKSTPVPSKKKEGRAEPKNAHERMLFDFEVRAGTNREKVLNALWEKKNKPVTRKELLKAVYGNQSEDNVGALNMVFKGLGDKLAKSKLPYAIVKGKTEEKEVTYALEAK